MRCLSCDKALNDYESTRKYLVPAGDSSVVPIEGDYIDLCNNCFSKSDLAYSAVNDRPDLMEAEDEVSEEVLMEE